MSDLNVYTTSQINALTPITGDLVVDSDLNAVKLYNGSAWKTFTTDGVEAFQNRWGASFDGSNDYIDLGTSSTLNPTSALTISVWIYINGAGTGGLPSIYSSSKDSTGASGGIALAYTSNKIRFYLDKTGSSSWVFAESNSTVSTGQWYHLAGIWNGSTVTLYVNGTAQTTTGSATTIGYNTDFPAAIGKYSSNYFQGLIDDISLFDSALSGPDITKIYNSGVPTDLTLASSYDTDRTSNLVGYWRMGDVSNDSATSGGSIATITDSSGNGNDATQGTASSQPTFSEIEQAGTSLNFVRSSSQYMERDFASVVGATAFTFGLWYKAGNYTNYQALFECADNLNGYSDGWRMMLNSGNELKFWYGTPGYTNPLHKSSNSADAYDWNYIVVTRSSAGDMSLYYNGNTTAIDTGTHTSVSGVTATHLRVAGTNWPYDGKIDEVSFFNSELTGSDLTALIGASQSDHVKNDLGLNPLAYWRMGEDDSLTQGASVSQITDASGNGNHLTQSAASNQPTASLSSTPYL
jgi:hypothetical protein